VKIIVTHYFLWDAKLILFLIAFVIFILLLFVDSRGFYEKQKVDLLNEDTTMD